MGFWGNLWETIKSPFRAVYDKVINPVVNTISGVYDKVKSYLPAPIRAVGDSIQGTAKQVQEGISTARDVMDKVGLKKGGMVMRDMGREAEPYVLKKHFQA